MRNEQKADQLIQQLVELPLQKQLAKQWLNLFSDRTDCDTISEYHKVVLKTTAEELVYQLIELIELIDANTQRSEASPVLDELFKLQVLSEKMCELEIQRELCRKYPHHLWKEYSPLRDEIDSALNKIQREIMDVRRNLMNKLVLILKDDDVVAE